VVVSQNVKMTRRYVSRGELHEILNLKLHMEDPCGECKFSSGPAPLRVVDHTGCNWSQELVLRRGQHSDDQCSRVASRVIAEIAEGFSLVPDGSKWSSEERSPKGSSIILEKMPSREIYLYFQIDTNRINSRCSLENMNRLEKWHRDGVIGVLMSDVANTEARAGYDSFRSRKASGYIYAIGFEHELGAREILRRIAAILFPKGCQSKNDLNDVRIVYNAWKYQHILITADKAILRKQDKLAKFGVTIVTDTIAVQLVTERILQRDNEAINCAHESGNSLPWWIGRD